jgi:hypothetical protein
MSASGFPDSDMQLCHLHYHSSAINVFQLYMPHTFKSFKSFKFYRLLVPSETVLSVHLSKLHRILSWAKGNSRVDCFSPVDSVIVAEETCSLTWAPKHAGCGAWHYSRCQNPHLGSVEEQGYLHTSDLEGNLRTLWMSLSSQIWGSPV